MPQRCLAPVESPVYTQCGSQACGRLVEYNGMTAALYPSATSTETTSGREIDFLSDGFKQRNANGNTNESGHNYIFMAFAEEPGTTPFDTVTNAR